MIPHRSFPALWIFIFVTGIAYSQAPEWVNETSRTQNYPSSSYRTGFYSEAKVHEEEAILNRLKELAKSDLIESIQVSIKSQSSLKTEETKTNFNELFVFESVSLSEQDIVGLQVLTYYDKKQKRASAFAFVRTQTLKDYYVTVINSGLNAIQQRLNNIQTTFGSGNLKSSVDEIFECRADLSKINHAQSILIALGTSDNQVLKVETTNKNKGEIAELMFKTLTDDRLTVNTLIHFQASSLMENMKKDQGKIKVGKFNYDGLQLYSDLSSTLSSGLLNEMDALKNLTIITEGTEDYLVSGSFKEVNDRIEITTTLTTNKDKRIISSSVASIAKKNIERENIAFLPLEIQKLNFVKKMSLTSTPASLKVRCNETLDANYKVNAAVKDVKEIDLTDLPISFYLNTVDNTAVVTANEKGEAIYVIRSVRSPVKTQFLNAEINLPAYLKMDASSADYKKLTTGLIIPKTKLQLNVYGNTLYVSSSELNIGQKLSSPYLEAGIVDALTKLGFEFTEDAASADYNLKINSNTRVGSSYDGLYFSYLDASISLVDTKSKKEVFSNQYRDVKGAGGNFEGAGTKAYSVGMKSIKDDLVTFFLK